MYFAIGIRTGIMFTVSYLRDQFNDCFDKNDWIAAKHILRYLKGIMDYVLEFKHSNSPLIEYSDANAGKIDRRSYPEYVFLLKPQFPGIRKSKELWH